MKIVLKKIDEIIPYENNAKLHPVEQIEQIKNSIIQFGNCDPIAIDENNVIIEGHGRLKALQELGYQEIECIVISGLTEEEKNAYRLVHNQLTLNSGWDLEKLKEELKTLNIDMQELGFEELLNELDEDINNTEEDNFDIEEELEAIEEPITKKGDIWELGNHRLICGDSTDHETISKLMNGARVDLLLTDPPYNVDYEGSNGLTIQNDNMNDNDFRNLLNGAFKVAFNVMKEGASFYIWFASSEHINFESALNEAGLRVRQELIWVKNGAILGRQDYQWKHEACLYGWKEGAAHYFIDSRVETTVIEDLPNINNMSKDELKQYVKELLKQAPASTIIREDKPLKNDVHPTMKPIKLMGYLIKNSAKKNSIVLDMFGGSGSTLIACEQLDRKCYMVELDPKYCDVIIKRWETLTGRKAMLINETSNESN